MSSGVDSRAASRWDSRARPERGQPYDHDVLFQKWTAWDRAIRNELAARTDEPPPRDPNYAT